MPFYQNLHPERDQTDKRIVENLIRLRGALRKTDIPGRSLNDTLLVATWNLRDFDKPSFGFRSKEAFYYIAEIIARFDLVAIQEVYKDLTALNEVMRILGSDWDYIFTDATEGAQGNGECIAFVFDKRKVVFGGLAGELVIPPEDNKLVPQFWRTPLICGFRAGWAKFMICSVHILWGKTQGSKPPPERIEEITRLAQFLKKRTEDKTAWARKLILLGDFNIGKHGDATYKPLEEAGFIVPEHLKEVYTNITRDKQYDQILFRQLEDSLEFIKGGTFDYFEHVFREEDEPAYAAEIEAYRSKRTKSEPNDNPETSESEDKKRLAYYRKWRTYQMSDHLPLWVAFRIDFSDEYLERKLKPQTPT
ncbi:MAG TPA: endonuclease/exonuclease/phosphatase [Bacteroidetes bacterium]|nr:endonuclease/exonuclease/phosphatase [Bacteroidota bacterium]HRR07520.1 endonuclease/exonuclease/phosphatase family protein [Rhodothermales bacterium]